MGITPVEPCTLAVSGQKEHNLPISTYRHTSQFTNIRRRLSHLEHRYRNHRALSSLRRRIRHRWPWNFLTSAPPTVK
jgi:hypothetical protein